MALELAAALANVLTVEQIASRLDDGLALLTTVVARHQTASGRCAARLTGAMTRRASRSHCFLLG